MSNFMAYTGTHVLIYNNTSTYLASLASPVQLLLSPNDSTKNAFINRYGLAEEELGETGLHLLYRDNLSLLHGQAQFCHSCL